MVILGIETSCDETAAAVVKDGTRVLSNVVARSQKMHIKTGGIIPEQAARQQIRSIIPVIQESLSRAFPSPRSTSYQLLATNVDAIAVTVGPGLIGSLLVGVETAKTLSYLWRKPIIPVNHLVAHIYANFIETKNLEPKTKNHNLNFKSRKPQFPLIALVVSGGHTDLVYMKGHGKIKLIGTTRDDAAGECFDKCARLLGFPYPGGPSISAAAEKHLTINHQPLTLFPRPMIDSDDFDFSFSGLKTAVLNRVKELESGRVKVNTAQLAAETQEAIVDVLVEKTLRAIKEYKPKSLLLGGGVAANFRLREKLELRIKNYKRSLAESDSVNLRVKLFIPALGLCTDNAAVIASCAFYNNDPVVHSTPSISPRTSSLRTSQGSAWQKVSANPELAIAS